MDILTFIIPSIGRNSLLESINSIKNQTSKNWKIIIVFDGCKNMLSEDLINDQIAVYEIDKTNGIINQASDVRNYALQFVDTKWVAFLDDDDTIAKDYVEYFFDQEIKYNFDIFIYRMINKDFKIFPSTESRKLIPCDVGISFIVKKNVFKKIKFKNSHSEDYDFLIQAKKKNYLILISNSVKYFVKSNDTYYQKTQLDFHPNLNIFINGINPVVMLQYLKNL